MIPTSIDGTDITGATIDGTDVTEITVDGQTVFTSETLPVAYSNLIAWYPFDSAEYGGSNADDVTALFNPAQSGDSTAYDGTVSGLTYQSGGGVTDINAGANSGAFEGNGSGSDGITVNGINGFGNDQPHTICFWCRLDSFNGFPVFLGDNSINRSSGIAIQSSTEWNWFFFSNDIRYDPSSEISIGTYAHVALSYEGGGKDPANETFYANANPMPIASDDSDGSSSNIPDPTQFSIFFENLSNQEEIDNEMDDVRIYNRALTSTEINQIYQNTKP